MTAAAPVTPSSTSSTPSIDKRRKEFMVYYRFCEPVERLFYETLRAHYPEMTVMDISVCRAAYIAVRTGGSSMYDRRMIWTFYNTPGKEMPRYLLENAALLLGPGQSCRSLEEARKILDERLQIEGAEELKDTPIFPTEHSFENAVGLAHMRGYLIDDDRVNKEIENLLEEALETSVRSEDYVSNNELFQHEREQADFDRCYAE